MKAKGSNTELGNVGAAPLVALPENAEFHLMLPENAVSEAELLDRLIGQQIVALFESAQSLK
jgi:hypothetical protein